MTESRVYRKQPEFKRSEILCWDNLPVPLRSESFRPASHRGAETNVRLHRENDDESAWVLVGDGNRREFDMGSGWDCALDVSLSDGHRCWTRQRPVGDTILRMWTTINSPGLHRTLSYTGSFEVTPYRIHGGSIQTGQLQILRFLHGLSISLENKEIGVRREWRLDQRSQRNVEIYDLLEPADSAPVITATSDNPVTLRKTVRWLILELTGLLVADEFLAWNGHSGIESEQRVLAVATEVAAAC